MDKTTVIVGGIVLIVIAGLGLYAMNVNGPTETPITPTPTPIVEEPGASTPAAPVAATDSLAVPGSTGAVVTGSISPNGALTSYWYEYGTTAALGEKSTTQNVGSGYISIPSPAFIVGLTKGTTYYYRVAAQNQFGTVTGVQRSFTTTLDTPTPTGTAPTTKTLAATGVTRTTANLSGEVTPNKAATQYWFEYGTSANLGNTTVFASIGDGSVKVPASHTLTNLSPLTTYYYRVNSQNKFGTENGTILSFKTSGPGVTLAPVVTASAPTGISATSATLRGTVTPNGAVATYWFEFSTDPNFVGSLMKESGHLPVTTTPPSTSVSALATDLAPKTTYYVRLVAQNATGMVRSDSTSFKTK